MWLQSWTKQPEPVDVNRQPETNYRQRREDSDEHRQYQEEPFLPELQLHRPSEKAVPPGTNRFHRTHGGGRRAHCSADSWLRPNRRSARSAPVGVPQASSVSSSTSNTNSIMSSRSSGSLRTAGRRTVGANCAARVASCASELDRESPVADSAVASP